MRTIIESDSIAYCDDKPWKISDLIEFLTKLEQAGYGEYYICARDYLTYIATGAKAIIPEPGEKIMNTYNFENRKRSKQCFEENNWKYMFIQLDGVDNQITD